MMEKEILAAIMASTSDIDMMTNDRIEALTKGHGMLNIAAICSANSIAEDVLRGTEIKLTDHNVQQLPIDGVLKKAIESAKLAGADSANAALITATLCYFAGTNAQAGVPAGNRKLGAMARMIAGVDRCGVLAIPTPKVNNKISGYAAVKALYDDIFDNKITDIYSNTRECVSANIPSIYQRRPRFISPSGAHNQKSSFFCSLRQCPTVPGS